MILKRYPYRPRHEHERPDPSYGVGYRPDWPSILSVAHDTADGGAVFVVTDRPCVLVPGPLALPLSVAGAGGLSVVAASEILPIKFRVALDGAVPAGAAWAWGSGASALIDPATGHAPNPATGACADTPGPYPPPPPAALTLVAASCTDAPSLTLTFDRPIDVSAMDPGLIRVDNGILTFSYVGYATPTLVGPRTVEVPLAGVDDYFDPGVHLTAAPGNGIVAAGDGAAWAGVADLSLPFP